MLENMLAVALCDFIREAVSGLRYEMPGGGFRSPMVYNGFLPSKRDARDDFPFVCVLPVKGSTDDDRTEIEVRLELGAYSEEFSGYADVMAIMARIRNALIMLPDRTLAGRFRLAGALSWTLDDEQPYPSWLLTITTTWEAYSPEVVLSNEAEVYGYFKD